MIMNWALPFVFGVQSTETQLSRLRDPGTRNCSALSEAKHKEGRAQRDSVQDVVLAPTAGWDVTLRQEAAPLPQMAAVSEHPHPSQSSGHAI